jgi:EmrB/QacA subfamily drug resistance transporter
VQEQPEDLSYAWRVLSVTSLGMMLCGLNSSTMDVALPVVAAHFHASASEATWIVLAFLLVNTSLILVFGRVADLVGRRRLYIVGLGVFTVASFLSGLAPNALSLAMLRGLQAVGAAALITNVTALLADAFPTRSLSTGLGLNVMAVSTAQMAGPVVGGALASSLGWRAAFWFNVPVGLIGLLWAMHTLRPSAPVTEREPFDLIGAVTASVGLAGLVLALAEGGAIGWTRPIVVVGALACVIGLPLFVAIERRRAYPMFDLRLLADRERAFAFGCAFLIAVARFAVVLLMSLYLQSAAGLDAFHAGLYVLPAAIGLAASSPIAGWLARRYDTRFLASAGVLVVVVGLIALASIISPSISRLQMNVCLLAVGCGTGLFMTPNTSSIMSGVRPSQRGMANGFRSSLQNTGFVVSTALGVALATTWLSDEDKREAYAGSLSQLSSHGAQELTSGVRLALVVMAAACTVGLIGSLLRSPVRNDGSDADEQLVVDSAQG